METFKLPMDFMDNFILKSRPEYALVYIYAYRHKTEGGVPSAEEISKTLNLSKNIVNEAVCYWTELGYDIFSHKKFPPSCDKSRYSAGEIAEFSKNDKELAILYEETEKILNKPLSSNDQQTLFWIYNDLGMSTPVIILIMNYAKSLDKCRMRYIEKIALEWSEKGIVTFADAEKHLSELERAASYEARLKKLFGIERNLISTEKAVVATWRDSLKPSKDELLRAYEICIERTGKFSAKYINAILSNWKEEKKSGISRGNAPTHSVPTPRSTKFNNFTQSSNIDHKKFEMDALRRRLEKNRGEEDAE